MGKEREGLFVCFFPKWSSWMSVWKRVGLPQDFTTSCHMKLSLLGEPGVTAVVESFLHSDYQGSTHEGKYF